MPAALVVALLSAGAGGAKPPKPPPSHLEYRLSVKFVLDYHQEQTNGRHELDAQFTFSGDSGQLLLNRTKTKSKVSYTLSQVGAPGVPVVLRIPGLLNVVGGGFTSNGKCTTSIELSMKGERRAAATVLLSKNGLQFKLESMAPVTLHPGTGCGGPLPDTVWPAGTFLGPTGKAVSPPQRNPAVPPSAVKYGKPFNLPWLIDYVLDPSLSVTDQNGLSRVWRYRWTFAFTPGQPQ